MRAVLCDVQILRHAAKLRTPDLGTLPNQGFPRTTSHNARMLGVICSETTTNHATGAWVLLPRSELARARVQRCSCGVAGAGPPLLLLLRRAPLLCGRHAPAQLLLLLLQLGRRLHLRLLRRRRVLLLLLALLPEHRIDVHSRLAQPYGHLHSEPAVWS